MKEAKKRWRVTGYRVLIRPDPVERVSKGGIVIVAASASQEKREQYAQMTGTIVDVGPTAWHQFTARTKEEWEPWAKVGDHVTYVRNAGRFVSDPENPGKELIILNDEDVLLKEEETIEDKANGRRNRNTGASKAG